MKSSNQMRTVAALGMLGVMLSVGLVAKRALAQEPAADGKSKEAAKKEASQDTASDPYQRSGQVLYMKRMGESGADRGQEIYYMKCWICHNDYTRKVDPKAAPTLKGLFKRTKLMSGKDVNEENVLTQIKEGSANMPSYKAGLSDKDLADLMSYLQERCCWDEQNPPANSHYAYGKK
jgi:mono/diheme cytochrome c family protein